MNIDAVIFDWGGTLTPWHTVDFGEEARALAEAAVEHDLQLAEVAAKLRDANQTVWGRSRDHHQSATVADIFGEAGVGHDADLLTAYREFWRPHTDTDPDAEPLFAELRERGLKVGVLSNTIWPRDWHREIFERDGLLNLIDGDVYTSELPWTKPSEHAFRAAMEAVGATDPARCVFVGDRLYDDIWGAHNAGLRAIHIPHSDVPPEQVGHTEGEPDAVAHRLLDVGSIVAGWI